MRRNRDTETEAPWFTVMLSEKTNGGKPLAKVVLDSRAPTATPATASLRRRCARRIHSVMCVTPSLFFSRSQQAFAGGSGFDGPSVANHPCRQKEMGANFYGKSAALGRKLTIRLNIQSVAPGRRLTDRHRRQLALSANRAAHEGIERERRP